MSKQQSNEQQSNEQQINEAICELFRRIQDLEQKERNRKNTWMHSDNFVKRAFAVFGYALLAYIMIFVVFGMLGYIVEVLVAGTA